MSSQSVSQSTGAGSIGTKRAGEENWPSRRREGEGEGRDLGERVGGELRDGEELVLGDEALGAAVELAEALVQRHDLLLRDLDSIRSIQGGENTQTRQKSIKSPPNRRGN